MRDRRAAALDEVAELKQRLKRKSKYSDLYRAEMEAEQRMADMIGSALPDEKTRRQPGFDMKRWREQQFSFSRGRRRKPAARSIQRPDHSRGLVGERDRRDPRCDYLTHGFPPALTGSQAAGGVESRPQHQEGTLQHGQIHEIARAQDRGDSFAVPCTG